MEGRDPRNFMIVLTGFTILSFVADAGMGGGVVLQLLGIVLDIRMFFLALLISSILFIPFWLYLSKIIGEVLVRTEAAVAALFVLAYLMLVGSAVLSSPLLFLTLGVLTFNLLSFTLFALTTRVLSKAAASHIRGRTTGVAAATALLLSSLVLWSTESMPSGQVVVRASILLSTTPIAMVFVHQGWGMLRDYGIRHVGEEQGLSVPKEIRYAVLSGALFLLGSGIAHGAIVSQSPGTLAVSRAAALVYAVPAVVIFGILSDRIGRYIVLIGAIALNTSSQILAFAGSTPQVIVGLEVAGYYTSLVFILLKLSDEITPRHWQLIGIAWGVIYAVDFIGALISTFLPVELLPILSIGIMGISLYLVFLTPNLLESDLKVSGVAVYRNGQVVSSVGEKHAGVENVPTADGDAPDLVEFSDGLKAVISRSGEYTTAAIVNMHSLSVVKKLIEFANTQLRTSGDRINLEQITDIFEIRDSPEGTSVKFMEM